MLHTKRGPIRTILVDDHRSFRQGLRSLLGSYADIEVVGEAENGEEVVHAMPYLLSFGHCLDINMPKLNGIEATCTIKANYSHVVIVGLSVHAGQISSIRHGRSRCYKRRLERDGGSISVSADHSRGREFTITAQRCLE
jgi:chemotaxis response regulator CheB